MFFFVVSDIHDFLPSKLYGWKETRTSATPLMMETDPGSIYHFLLAGQIAHGDFIVFSLKKTIEHFSSFFAQQRVVQNPFK